MSQNLRQQQREDKNDTLYIGGKIQNQSGFEGMNYEQLRQPYQPKSNDKNKAGSEQNKTKPPNES